MVDQQFLEKTMATCLIGLQRLCVLRFRQKREKLTE